VNAPTREEILDEERRARWVRMIVDFTSSMIMQSRPSRNECEQLIRAARAKVLELFPGKEETFDIIYAPRFQRIMDEFSTPNPPEPKGPAVVIPFPHSPR
jgi:hypothetical protein